MNGGGGPLVVSDFKFPEWDSGSGLLFFRKFHFKSWLQEFVPNNREIFGLAGKL